LGEIKANRQEQQSISTFETTLKYQQEKIIKKHKDGNQIVFFS